MATRMIACCSMCFFIMYITFLNSFCGTFVKATTTPNTTDAGVRDWLNTLNQEASTLQVTANKLERVVAMLIKANSSSAAIRQSQLTKIQKARSILIQEIQIVNSTCAIFDGPNCDIPKCNSKCDVCNVDICTSCKGNWDGLNCSTCKSGWGGSNCDIQQLVQSSNAFKYGNTSLKSCVEYKNLFNDTGSGLYWIKPDATKAEFVVYCEQTFNGGGWILITTRQSSITPYYSDIVNPTNDGASIRDDKWAMVRLISTDIMWRDATGSNGYGVSAISFWSAANCKPLTTKLTDLTIAYAENGACDGVGSDYCILGSDPVAYNSYVYGYCGVAAHFKQWTFSGSCSYLQMSNAYVR